jgi:uridine kinase
MQCGPDAFDFELIEHVLSELAAGRAADVPQYDFKTHSRYKCTCAINRVRGSNASVLQLPGISLLNANLAMHTFLSNPAL